MVVAVRAWKKTYPNLNESTVLGFKKCYEAKLKEASHKNVSPKKKLANKMCGRPTLLGQKLDTLVQKFLRATRYKGGVVNTQTALTTAKALVKRYLLLEKKNLVLGAPWAKSLFRRMGFGLRRKTTAKVLTPEGALKEAELKFHHQIVDYVEKYQIPPWLIINFDQTPSNYVQISSNRMEKKGTKNVPISGIDDKRSITATFSITMENKFFPMQLKYKGKTSHSLPKIQFPNGLSLSANLKHCSNRTESLKFFKEIILPYVKTEGERLGLETQPALLIYDDFRGQTTDKFLDVLKGNNTLSTKIPPDMTHAFQPLDLTVNKFARDFMKRMFSTWSSRQISLGLENGVELDDIEDDYRLSVLKPLHVKWLVELYNHMSTDEGKEIVANGSKKAGIFDAIKLGSSGLPSLDPFADICPLIESLQLRENLSLSILFPEEPACFREKIQESEVDSNSECDSAECDSE